MYSPRIHDEHVRPLYRLARVRGVSMTSIVNDLLAAHLEASRGEIASYDPAVHDRKPRRRAEDRADARAFADRLAA